MVVPKADDSIPSVRDLQLQAHGRSVSCQQDLEGMEDSDRNLVATIFTFDISETVYVLKTNSLIDYNKLQLIKFSYKETIDKNYANYSSKRGADSQ